MQTLKQIFSKLKTWFSDHYHLLFKSAAVNHLRIQELLKNPDGSYQLTVKFGSYSELKNYQKKLRRMTVSLSSAVAMVVVAFIVAPFIMNPNRSAASTFLWVQESWVGAGTGATKQYPGDNVGVTDYTSKSNIDISSGDATLTAPNPTNVQDTSFIAQDGFYIKDNVLKLKKPVSAGCGGGGDAIGNNECVSNLCESNLCTLPCGQLTVSRDGKTYGTVVGANGKCWLDRNLGAAQVATAYNDSQAYGWYFQWGRGADGHQIPTSALTPGPTTSATPGSNFITMSVGTTTWYNGSNPDSFWQGVNGPNNPCPTGFRIPTQAEWNTLITVNNITNASTAYSNTALKLTAAGYRVFNGNFTGVSSAGYYWESNVVPGGDRAYRATFTNSIANNTNPDYRVLGFSVRCIKN